MMRLNMARQSVNTIIQNRMGKYLLQMRDGTEGICNPLKWNFFGGGMTDNEDPIDCAIRETQEELDLSMKPSDLELIGEFCPEEDKHVFVVRYKQPVEWQDVTIREGAGAGFFTKEELLRIDVTDATRRLAEKFLSLIEW